MSDPPSPQPQSQRSPAARTSTRPGASSNEFDQLPKRRTPRVGKTSRPARLIRLLQPAPARAAMSSAHPDWPRGRLARSKTGGPNIEDALRTFAADKILVARALAHVVIPPYLASAYNS